MNEKIDISKLICDKLIENQRTIAWLARKLNRNSSSFGKLLKKNFMDIKLLFDISIALQFDFFCCFSDTIPDLPKTTDNKELNAGKLIQSKLIENQRSISWLAKKIHIDRTSLFRRLKKDTIDSVLLLNISVALQFDFFSCYSVVVREYLQL